MSSQHGAEYQSTHSEVLKTETSPGRILQNFLLLFLTWALLPVPMQHAIQAYHRGPNDVMLFLVST